MIAPTERSMPGQDHQRLRGADDADDRHLLQDQRQREGREEAAAQDRPKAAIDSTSTISGTAAGFLCSCVLERRPVVRSNEPPLRALEARDVL
jgi:hypothetical protein